MSWCCLLIVSVIAIVAAAPNQKVSPPVLPIGALSFKERQHFLDVFSAFNRESLKEAHYAFLGNSAFDHAVIDGVTCDKVRPNFDSPDPETRYYALSAARGIKSCTVCFYDSIGKAYIRAFALSFTLS